MFESAPNKANTPAEDRRSDGIGIGVGGEIHRYVSVYVCACVGKHHLYLGEAAKTSPSLHTHLVVVLPHKGEEVHTSYLERVVLVWYWNH